MTEIQNKTEAPNKYLQNIYDRLLSYQEMGGWNRLMKYGFTSQKADISRITSEQQNIDAQALLDRSDDLIKAHDKVFKEADKASVQKVNKEVEIITPDQGISEKLKMISEKKKSWREDKKQYDEAKVFMEGIMNLTLDEILGKLKDELNTKASIALIDEKVQSNNIDKVIAKAKNIDLSDIKVGEIQKSPALFNLEKSKYIS